MQLQAPLRGFVNPNTSMPDYSRFSADDFLDDDAFLRWVRQPTPETDHFWQTFLDRQPGQQAAVASARQFLLTLDFDGILSADEKRQMWQTIRQGALTGPAPHRQPNPVRPLWGNQAWLRAAAVVSGLLVLGGLGYEYQRRQPVEVNTAYSQLRQVTLPDGSAITLNAHSTLHYGKDWNQHQTREVWLDGEAFFNIRHTATNQKFIVHTPDVTVEVLGTTFDLFRRDGTTKVALATGRVRVSAGGTEPQQLIMKPGDLVEFSRQSNRLTRRPVNVTAYAAWTRRKLVFDDTPMAEVIALLHDNYGFTVRLTDDTILAETLSGEIQTDSEATLLRALGKALDVRITKDGSTLTIERAN